MSKKNKDSKKYETKPHKNDEKDNFVKPHKVKPKDNDALTPEEVAEKNNILANVDCYNLELAKQKEITNNILGLDIDTAGYLSKSQCKKIKVKDLHFPTKNEVENLSRLQKCNIPYSQEKLQKQIDANKYLIKVEKENSKKQDKLITEINKYYIGVTADCEIFQWRKRNYIVYDKKSGLTKYNNEYFLMLNDNYFCFARNDDTNQTHPKRIDIENNQIYTYKYYMHDLEFGHVHMFSELFAVLYPDCFGHEDSMPVPKNIRELGIFTEDELAKIKSGFLPPKLAEKYCDKKLFNIGEKIITPDINDSLYDCVKKTPEWEKYTTEKQELYYEQQQQNYQQQRQRDFDKQQDIKKSDNNSPIDCDGGKND